MPKDEVDIIIIGAGIAGLSAGCYAQMNGYNTQIFEMHDKAGGLCTSWKRKGYLIDGCIHSLVGCAPGTGFYRLWEEVGAVQERRMVIPEQLARIEGREDKVLNFYTNLDRLEKHLKELAPEDKQVIERFIKDARTCARCDLPVEKAFELFTLIDGLKFLFKLLPLIPIMRKWSEVSLQSFAQAIERRYLGLGGRLRYKSPVAKVLVENDRAVGVRLADSSEHRSNIVVSAADGRTTIFDMLDGGYVDQKIQDYYQKLPLFKPMIHIAFGVSRTFDDLPSLVTGLNYPLKSPVTVCGRELNRLTVHAYNFDPTLAPEGKTVMRC